MAPGSMRSGAFSVSIAPEATLVSKGYDVGTPLTENGLSVTSTPGGVVSTAAPAVCSSVSGSIVKPVNVAVMPGPSA